MIFIPVIAVLAACWHSFVLLHQQWTDWENKGATHGYVIAAICLWLLWRKRQTFEALGSRFSWRHIWPLASVMACWLLVVMAGIQSFELLLIPLILWSAICAGLGWCAARAAAFPAGYFLFATPIWGFFNGLFQWSSIYAVRGALRVAGIPAYFDENLVHIPEGTFEIAGGCSGLHFVVVGAAIAALMGELRRDELIGRIKLLLLATGLAMFANWLRIFIIVEAGHLTHMQHYLVARSHYGFGWVVFGVCMALFYWLESRMPVSKSAAPIPGNGNPRWQRVAMGVVPVMAVFALWHALAARPAAPALNEAAARPGWTIQSSKPGAWQPVLAGVDESSLMHYRRDDGVTVEAYAGLYRRQEQGKEFSAYGNDLNPGASPVDEFTEEIGNVPFAIRKFREATGGESLIASTFRVGDNAFANPVYAQLWYGVKALMHLRSPMSQVLLLHTACVPDCAAALSVLQDWEEGP